MSARILRLHDLRVPYGAGMGEIERAAARKVGVDPSRLGELRIAKRSIDVRRAPQVLWSLAVEFEGDPALIAGLPPNQAGVVEPLGLEVPGGGAEDLAGPVVIVGAGPAGLFAALTLAENAYAPVVLERGKRVEERDGDVTSLISDGRLDPESNLLFGEGGAGAYSDGKLTTRISDPHVRRVLEMFVECGAPHDILIDARPHIGSDLLGGVVRNLRKRIESLGGRFRYGFRVERLVLDERGAAVGVESAEGDRLPAGAVLAAPGNAARGLIETLLAQGVAIEAKPFQIGVRIEHPQAVIDRAVYRKERGDLPPAEYALSARPQGAGRGVASFCMCPGGMVVPAIYEPRCLSTNGASAAARAGRFANAALVVTLKPEDPGEPGPLAGFRFQRALEKAAFEIAGDYRAPAQRAADFLAGRESDSLPECSYPLGVVPADLTRILPDFFTAALRAALPVFERRLPGFIKEGLLVGVEPRVSSAVRILREGESRQSVSTPNFYPAGEGSGYAGGIMSSAVDGIRTAESVITRFAPAPRG